MEGNIGNVIVGAGTINKINAEKQLLGVRVTVFAFE